MVDASNLFVFYKQNQIITFDTINNNKGTICNSKSCSDFGTEIDMPREIDKIN